MKRRNFKLRVDEGKVKLFKINQLRDAKNIFYNLYTNSDKIIRFRCMFAHVVGTFKSTGVYAKINKKTTPFQIEYNKIIVKHVSQFKECLNDKVSTFRMFK